MTNISRNERKARRAIETIDETITHVFATLPEAVFDTWVTSGAFAVWRGMPDVHWHGEFLVIDRPNKLVMTMTDEPAAEREQLTVVWTAVDGGPEMRSSQTCSPSLEQYAGTAAGWRIAFDALDVHLTD